MPQSSTSSSEDDDDQDDLYSENDRDFQGSGPLTTAPYGNGDDNDDLPTFNNSETDEDDDTEDSNGDEDNDDHSQDEDNDDVPASNSSETNEDEDTENSNGDEDTENSNGDEDTEDSNGDEDTEDSSGDENISDAPISCCIETDEDTENSNSDEDNEDDIGSPDVKSYFLMKSVAVYNQIPANIKLKCTNTESDSGPISFRSKSVEWTLYPHELDSTKDYELVIGISANNLRIVDIEEVVFTVNGVEERVEQESHKDEELNETDVLRWKLATLKTVQYNNRMEVQVTLSIKLKPMEATLRTKFFTLHYMELHSAGKTNWSTESGARVYRPLYDWALDIRCNGSDDTIPYAISESGDYLVTYRTAIELWDLTNNSPSMPPNPSASTGPFRISAADLEHFSLSISWDGSQIAVSSKGSPFKLFESNRLKSRLEESAKAKAANLAGFDGSGIFHIGAGCLRQGPEDEIFVTVDQKAVHIYSVQHEWKLLRSIHLNSPKLSDPPNPRLTSHDISNVIQGRHFACRSIDIDDNMTDSIFIWNLDSGRLVRSIKAAGKVFPATESLSSDASLLLGGADGVITSFCSRTGAHLATYDYILGSAVPVRGSNGLFHTSDGLIRSGVDFAPIYRSCQLRRSANVLWISNEGESFKAFVKDRFWIFRQTWKSSPCNKDCLAKLKAARKNIWFFNDFESRLHFEVELIVGFSVEVTITKFSGGYQNLCLEKTDGVTWKDVTFSPKDRALIVEDGTLTRVYEMPRRISEKGSLVAVLDPGDKHLTCDHERSYFRPDCPSSLLQLKKDQMATLAPALRQLDCYRLPFSNGDIFSRYVNQRINQRCGTEEFTSDGRTVSAPMMKKLCTDWDMEGDGTSLFKKVLSLPVCQWVPWSIMEFNPVQHFLGETNLSRRTATHAKTLFDLLSDYCHQRANSEQNLLFMSPIAACLPTLLDPKLTHPKLAILALQKMAFFPVSFRSFIMERQTVIHPPEFRVEFWNPNPRALSQCEGPILQLESSGASEIAFDAKDAFKDEIFAATFNMIWTDTREPVVLKDTSYPAGVSPSIFYWITMAPFVVVYKLKPWLGTVVTCHVFPPDALDNPALSALILYKWSTLGFYIWLTRFTFQCIFYALVIVTVFIQVYAPTHASVIVLSGMIGVMSSTFLLLELSQALSNWSRYSQSFIYNFVDFAVFALPLGGCINQFIVRSSDNEDSDLNPRGPNSWLFSFSILVIALHMLFELRVNKAVFQFVTAILRIFFKIRIFFVIFLVGLLAFTTALLHLLRGCVQEPCAELTTSYPDNFYLAFSTTFFFMGGKYDQVGDVFTQSNSAFHTMMIIYLFFTVILMFNVLIALINSGYDESDTTWELNWLQTRLLYIESAENLSYAIPGLREKYDIFPQEIYYCLSEAKIQEYKTRWSKSDGLWSPKEDDLWTGPKDSKKDPLKQKVEELRREVGEFQREMEKRIKRLNELIADVA
ncbi:hypothetical protein BGZ96_002565 [Linnemannia gamsii]|uniref:Ion transport domain-containing protein n=1 Tax=Linnemannia gamsii TaxID=64522 RepID=A0ABQ7K9F2_9FUNG|nr:hypothetical protein BGZ96_002565 [Linnemannia gamsii]